MKKINRHIVKSEVGTKNLRDFIQRLRQEKEDFKKQLEDGVRVLE